MEYCCIRMEEADKKEIIDYCEPNLTTIDCKGWCLPINFCPFCRKKLEGSIKHQEILAREIGKLGIEEQSNTVPASKIKSFGKFKNLKGRNAV